MDTYTDRIL